jgi:threonine/homoserine/homoserine lactone efflux protein
MNKLAGAILWLGATILFTISAIMIIMAAAADSSTDFAPIVLGTVLGMLGIVFMLVGTKLLFHSNEADKTNKSQP